MIRVGCITKIKEDKDDVILNHVIIDEQGTGYENPEHHESEAMALWYCDTRNIVVVNEFLFTQIAQVKMVMDEDCRTCTMEPTSKDGAKLMTENEVRSLLTDNNVQFNA